jgi:hypothetical protein
MNFPRNLYIELAREEKKSAEFIESTLDYIDNLNRKKLPVIFSLLHFSKILKIDYDKLNSTIHFRHNQYSYYLIKKRSGGYRRIITPHNNIKKIQNWIKENILDFIEVSPQATGFVKGKSILDNAIPHKDKEAIINIDLKNFFESINERRVYGIFKSLGYSKNLSVYFAKICTAKIPESRYDNLNDTEQEHFKDMLNLKEAVLVQGAPTSPILSNLVCKRLDYRLSNLAIKQNLDYTRYADDMTFSGSRENLPKIGLLKKIIENENFLINWNKVGTYKKGQKQVVTSLLIDNGIRIQKKFKKEIYRHLFFCNKFGAYSHFQKVSPDKGYGKEWLLGKIMFVNSIEPNEAKKMFKLVKTINWEL